MAKVNSIMNDQEIKKLQECPHLIPNLRLLHINPKIPNSMDQIPNKFTPLPHTSLQYPSLSQSRTRTSGSTSLPFVSKPRATLIEIPRLHKNSFFIHSRSRRKLLRSPPVCRSSSPFSPFNRAIYVGKNASLSFFISFSTIRSHQTRQHLHFKTAKAKSLSSSLSQT